MVKTVDIKAIATSNVVEGKASMMEATVTTIALDHLNLHISTRKRRQGENRKKNEEEEERRTGQGKGMRFEFT